MSVPVFMQIVHNSEFNSDDNLSKYSFLSLQFFPSELYVNFYFFILILIKY